MNAHHAYVGLGANLADARANVLRALAELRQLGKVRRRSSLYRTHPWGRIDQPDFINAVALLETPLSPGALLQALKGIERKLGRVPGPRWGPRLIDLDLLSYDDLEIDHAGLHVPHERLRERAFVLVPLAEIDAAFEPLRAKLPVEDLAGVVAIADDAASEARTRVQSTGEEA